MSVLVVAFDGLDYELIQKYECNNIIQQEFGRIDNDTNIYWRMTSELFASFLTGKTWRDHGVRGLVKWNNRVVDAVENYLLQYKLFRKFCGIRAKIYQNILGIKRRQYLKTDYDPPTVLKKVNDSVEIDMPAYNPRFSQGDGLLEKYGISAAVKQQNAIFEYKTQKLFEAIDAEHDLVMAHFHKVDHFQHWFWEIGDEETVKAAYHETDNLAAKILENAEDKYDLILFMSDHGLPEGGQHNKNAFHSSNIDLGLEHPHITDFHDLILEHVENQWAMEVEEIDV